MAGRIVIALLALVAAPAALTLLGAEMPAPSNPGQAEAPRLRAADTTRVCAIYKAAADPSFRLIKIVRLSADETCVHYGTAVGSRAVIADGRTPDALRTLPKSATCTGLGGRDVTRFAEDVLKHC